MSDRQFFTFSARFCLLLGLLFCIYKAVRRGIGDWYFRKESPGSIQAAIKWDGDNPQYYDALGTLTHFYGNTKDLDASVAFYENATRLSPYDAHFWSDLGAAYDWAGRTNDASRAFERAIQLFPASPEINWRVANFAFRTHRIPEGLRSLRIVLAGGTPAHRDVFLLATRATRDNGEILEDMLPRQASTFFDYLNFQIETGNMVAAEQVWSKMLQLNLPVLISALCLPISRRVNPTPRGGPSGSCLVGLERAFPGTDQAANERSQFDYKWWIRI